MLRADLRFEQGSKPSTVVAIDSEGQAFELHEVDCLVARDMNGSRDLDTLMRRARRYVATASRAQLEEIVLQLGARGLISNLPAGSELPPAKATEGSSTGLPWRPQRSIWWRQPWGRRAVAVLVVACVLLLLALVRYPRYVTEPCVVRPTARNEVRAQVEGLIKELLVDEASHVQKGQVLARLEERDLDAALQSARAQVERAKANLQKMKRGARVQEIARASAVLGARTHELDFAKLEAERHAALFAQKVGSGADRDAANRQLQLATKAVEQAAAELSLVRAGFREEEIAVAEAELSFAQVEVSYLEKKMQYLTIVAPIEGVVVTPKLHEHLNRRVAAGETVCEIVNSNQLDVEVLISEREVDVVQVGQPAVVKVHAYPLRPFSGTVSFLAPSVEERGEHRFLRALVTVSNPQGLLYEGMSGFAEIDTGAERLLWLMTRRAVRWVRVRLLI